MSAYAWITRRGDDGVWHDDFECFRHYEPWECEQSGPDPGYHHHNRRPCTELRKVLVPAGRGISGVAMQRLTCDTCGLSVLTGEEPKGGASKP